MIRNRNGIFVHVVGIAVMLAVTACSSSICAQATDSAGDFPHQAVVLEDDLYVRCGGGETFYPFGQIGRGDIVTVTDEQYGWARVQTSGPAFKNMFGYVQANDIRLEPGRASGLTLGKVQIFAPNAYRNMAPEASWRPIGDIAPERTVVVLGTVIAGDNVFHKIVLPGACEGWVSARYLRKASEREVAEWASRTWAIEDNTQNPNADTEDVDSSQVVQVNDDSDPPTEVLSANNPATDKTGELETDPHGMLDEMAADVTSEVVNEVSEQPQLGLEATSITADVLAQRETDEVEVIDMPDLQPSEDITKDPDATTIEDLESAYEKLKTVAIRDAEVEALRNQYQQALGRDDLDRRGTAIARARIQLLEARLQLQKQVRKLDEVRVRSARSTETFEAARVNIESATKYTAVGRITVSTIFDGERLPRLLRLTETGTGRTIAYIEPDGVFDDAMMIDQVIGVVGRKQYDEGLRLNIIAPERIDLLTKSRRVR